ncbi:hypothetical protein FRC19_001815 [Serendipita sp. 401]|nr:hypothetical protein FRC19_001815 [Serendipita sp. 401]
MEGELRPPLEYGERAVVVTGTDAAADEAALYGIASRSFLVAATMASRAASAVGRGMTEMSSFVRLGSFSNRA